MRFYVLAILTVTLMGCSTFLHNSKSAGKVAVPEQIIPVPPGEVNSLHMATEADYHFALGETYSFEGNPQKAVEEFKLTLVYDPESLMVHKRLAIEYMKLGLISESITQGEIVVKKNPKDFEARLLLGGLFSSIKSYEKAISHYEYVIKHDPKTRQEALLYMGAVYAEKGELKASLKYFNKVVRIKGGEYNHLAYYYIGRIHLQKKHMKSAEKAYISSLNAKPDFIESVIALGVLYEGQSKKEKTKVLYSTFQDQHGPSVEIARQLSQLYLEEEDYENASIQYEIIQAAEPSNLNVRVKLALIAIEQKNYDAAVERLSTVLTVAPESDKIRFYLAAVYEEMKSHDEAIHQFAVIQPSSSFYGEARVHISYLYKLQKKLDLAEKSIAEAIKRKPDYPQFYALYASLLDEQKKYSEAETMLGEASQRFPEDEQILFFLGSIQDKTGNREKTIESMKGVLALNSEHVQALNYLAYTYADLGLELEKAQVLAKKALELKPGDAYIKDTVGWVYFKSGKLKEALKYLESAYKIRPDESVIAEHLGDAYYQYELFGRAKSMYEKAYLSEKDIENAEKIKSKIENLQKLITSRPNYRTPASEQ